MEFCKTNKKTLLFVFGFFLVSIFLLFLRFITKIVINFFPDRIVCNYGISFGLQIPIYIFIPVWLFLIFFLLILIWRSYRDCKYFELLAYFFIVIGGINNLLDRIVYGCVIDYIKIIPWNVFNLSDVFISVGAFMIFYKLIK